MQPPRPPLGAPPRFTVRVAVAEPTQAGEARRLAAALGREIGLPEADAGRLAIVVTEAARNLAAHARGGELLLRTLEDGAVGVEVLAVDRGPGMGNLAECLRDGYSTAGTPGTGLGAISRLANAFDVHSTLGGGTALLARVRAKSPQDGHRAVPLGAVCLPKAGEEVPGDAWAVAHAPARSLVLVSDGLGHGRDAAEASSEAVAAFERHAGEGPEAVLEAAHGALRATRGAAVAVAEIDPAERTVHFAGIGNISGVILAGGSSRHLVSHNGTVGHAVRKIQLFSYPWPQGALLVMHSDGLATHWSLGRYPGLEGRDPGLTAAVLYRDFSRGRDDVTVVALATEERRPLPA